VLSLQAFAFATAQKHLLPPFASRDNTEIRYTYYKVDCIFILGNIILKIGASYQLTKFVNVKFLERYFRERKVPA
jgi:hypothetical protein